MVDNFEVEPVFKDRQHKRHQFKLVIEGKQFKGDYTDGEIHWLHPHPKQTVGEEEVQAVETEIHQLLNGEDSQNETETDDIEIEPMLNNQSRQMHMFKLKINDEIFKGTFRHGEIEWFHPKPRRKLDNEHVEKVEEKVQKELKSRIDDE